MKRLELLLPFLLVLFCFNALAAPQAHWYSSDHIHLYISSVRTKGANEFDLVSNDNSLRIPLKTVERRGDFWKLAVPKTTLNYNKLIKRPLWIAIRDVKARPLQQVSVRLTGLLDERFADPNRSVGLSWKHGNPLFTVWAPTAQKVELLLFQNSHKNQPQVFEMSEDANGFWTVSGSPQWKYKYYLYRVTVFSPFTETIEVNEVTDPASVSLSSDGQLSQIVDMNDPSLMPIGWTGLKKPKLDKITDSVAYELHIRDFTTLNSGLPVEDQGKYSGLFHPQSRALQYFKDLAQAGLTHVHLLPVQDFAGVPEVATPLEKLAIWPLNVAPDSPLPQEKIGTNRNWDSYNWGYNPVHWMTPEGSYSKNPDGADRILEFRNLVKTFNDNGLRVVIDVVFNHTYAAGLEDFSVVDRIVPGYYHRYNERGDLMKSSCCPDVATENLMVEKLIIDSLIHWVTAYKVDGFRFDLLNLHPKSQADKIRHILSSLTPQRSGVDGSKLLIYAEAWPFGSLEEIHPGRSFFQLRSYGSGIAVFNDRFRDALRGGTTSSKEKSDQGFATGLFWDFNHEPANTNTPIDSSGQREKILYLGDIVKAGLIGNLRDYKIRDRYNNYVSTGQLHFRGTPVGYAAEPHETLTYVSAHDGYALWDAVQAKLPFETRGRNPATASVEDRVRTQKLMLATVALSQGIPFFEGGSELLRSKSGDVDSYDSGDWFNWIDLSFNVNNWGVGLPPLWRNQGDWPFWQPRLAHSGMQVRAEDITSTREYFKALLSLRKSSPLFRLSSLRDITESITFPVNEINGVDVPGLIVMLIEDRMNVDPKRHAVAVFINSSSVAQVFENQALRNRNWRLPNALDAKVDPFLQQAHWNRPTGRVQIPPRTVLVLEELQ